MGPAAYMGMSVTDPDDFYHIISGVSGPALNAPAGDELTYVRGIARQTRAYQSVIERRQRAFRPDRPPIRLRVPTTADRLKIVARLVAGGLKTKLYMVSIGGFDTHSSRRRKTATLPSEPMRTSRRQLSEAILAFQIGCAFLNIEDHVVGMTYSNSDVASSRTPASEPTMARPHRCYSIRQSRCKAASWERSVIPYQAGSNNNLPMQYDFRSVYASILQDWFCVPPTDLQTILFNNYQTLPIIKSSACLGIGIHELRSGGRIATDINSPNPFSSSTYITYTTQGGHTRVQVFSPEGKLIKNLVDAEQSAGTWVWFENEHFAPGVYYARLQNGPIAQVANMVIVP